MATGLVFLKYLIKMFQQFTIAVKIITMLILIFTEKRRCTR